MQLMDELTGLLPAELIIINQVLPLFQINNLVSHNVTPVLDWALHHQVTVTMMKV